jgi:hypothetical protein
MFFAKVLYLGLCQTQLVQIGPEGAKHLYKGAILYQFVNIYRSLFGGNTGLVGTPVFEAAT